MIKAGKYNKYCAIIALVLGLMQVVLVFSSWFITAINPDTTLHSLLSPEGIRWLFGSITTNLSNPLLVWLILLSLAYGALQSSGLLHVLVNFKSSSYPQRYALRIILMELVVFFVIILLLTAVPHAILLNVTGSLFPSSFSTGIIPYLCLTICVMSISFGVISGLLTSLQSVYYCLTTGIDHIKLILPIYILGIELYYSALFVLAN